MTAGILLMAAGRGSRFGSDKRRALLGNGSSLLVATLDSIAQSDLPLRVCLAPGDDEVQEILDERGVSSLCCPRARQGMGATLADGVAALPAEWSGVLVALADMPWIRSDSYVAVSQAICAAQETEAGPLIVVPEHRGQRGHPVGFSRDFFPQLAALGGDRGARGVLRDYASSVRRLPLEDPGVLRDVDTPADLR